MNETFPHCYVHIPPPKPDVIRYLRDQGVSVDANCEPELPAFSEVTFNSGHTFEFTEEGGDGALIFLARDPDGEPLDMVAWSAKRGKLAAWYGRAPVLGLDGLYAPRLNPENAVPVHETPLQWLFNERYGLVIVHPRRAAPILRAAEPLAASSAAFGLRLRNLLALAPSRIYVPLAAHQKAA
jgi:hypothetical protein